MKFVRSLVISCLFSASLASAASDTLRLAELPVVRFSQTAPGQWTSQTGTLSPIHGFRPTGTAPVLSSVSIPPAALNKNLVSLDAWLAYQRLGNQAVRNFIADTDGTQHRIGERFYLETTPDPDPLLSQGRLANFSSRGRVAPSQPLIGGFVIDEQHRWILVRAVGPTLAALGVEQPLPDPFLTIYKGHTGLMFNDDWSTRHDAAQIAAVAVQVGAFALPNGSADSALLVELAPGAYTAHVVSMSDAAGDVLLEMYSVPQ